MHNDEAALPLIKGNFRKEVDKALTIGTCPAAVVSRRLSMPGTYSRLICGGQQGSPTLVAGITGPDRRSQRVEPKSDTRNAEGKRKSNKHEVSKFTLCSRLSLSLRLRLRLRPILPVPGLVFGFLCRCFVSSAHSNGCWKPKHFGEILQSKQKIWS